MVYFTPLWGNILIILGKLSLQVCKAIDQYMYIFFLLFYWGLFKHEKTNLNENNTQSKLDACRRTVLLKKGEVTIKGIRGVNSRSGDDRGDELLRNYPATQVPVSSDAGKDAVHVDLINLLLSRRLLESEDRCAGCHF